MKVGEVGYAERKAMELFDQWNDVTGCFPAGTGYYGEIEACIIDAVHIGIQMALYGKLKFNKDKELIIHSVIQRNNYKEAK